MSRDAWLARLSTEGMAIAESVPIVGEVTNADCIERSERVDEVLGQFGVVREHGDRHWYTCVMESGLVGGRWATSVEEAVVENALWRGEPVVRAEADDDLTLHEAMKLRRGQVALW